MSNASTLAEQATITLAGDASEQAEQATITLATRVASEGTPAEQAFLSEAEAERVRIASFDKAEATTFLATSDARQALANRKMFETSYMVRMSMGATLYRLYVLACDEASVVAKVAEAVNLPRILTCIVMGAKVKADDGVSKGNYSTTAKTNMFGLSWDTLYDNYDLFRFGTSAKVLAWQDYAQANGLSPDSTKAFTAWARRSAAALTPQARAQLTKADNEADAKAKAEALLVAEAEAKRVADAKRQAEADKAKAEAEAKRVETLALAPTAKVIGGKSPITMARLRNLTPAERVTLRETLDILIAEDVKAEAEAKRVKAEDDKRQAEAGTVTIDTAAIIDEAKREAEASTNA